MARKIWSVGSLVELEYELIKATEKAKPIKRPFRIYTPADEEDTAIIYYPRLHFDDKNRDFNNALYIIYDQLSRRVQADTNKGYRWIIHSISYVNTDPDDDTLWTHKFESEILPYAKAYPCATTILIGDFTSNGEGIEG